jgi:hypothetical protein
MPVYRLVEEMPHEELLAWISYFERRPVGWREDVRAAYLMNAFGDKRKPQDIFPSLKILGSSSTRCRTDSLRGSTLFHKLLSAKGGDKLEVLNT